MSKVTRSGVLALFACATIVAMLQVRAAAADDLHARYLANAGVMLQHDDTTVMFDPLFRNSYGRYELVPEDVERAMFNAEPPFEDIDAIFISHHHGDHFDPAVMLEFLKTRREIELYAPAQAIDAIVSHGADDSVSARMTRVTLDFGDAPVSFNTGAIRIDAVRIPHSGWPDRMTDVENIAWRVTLDDTATIVHLGDADPRPSHFHRHETHWKKIDTELALPPYWFFASSGGRAILDETVQPRHAIGVHVPAEVPDSRDEWPQDFADVDLFTSPGEERHLPHGDHE